MLEHMAEPGAFVFAHAPQKSAGLAVRAAVLGQAGQGRGKRIDKLRAQPAGGPGLELAEVQLQPDDGKARVQRRADVDRTIEDAHAGGALWWSRWRPIMSLPG